MNTDMNEQAEAKLKKALDILKRELRTIAEQDLTPIALKYGYTGAPIELDQSPQSVVLFLGDFAAGKSTLINELMGSNIQLISPERDQDVFTVLMGHANDTSLGVTIVNPDELLNHPELPFRTLKHHGPAFLQKLRVKRITAPLLQDLILVDTPAWEGGETPQEFQHEAVIRDFLRIADVIVILLTPGNVDRIRGRYEEMLKILPRASLEDKIVLVLNRVDQCQSMGDLMRVYGSLCWSVGQVSQRQDLPPIHLMYMETAARRPGQAFLQSLTPIREGLRESILRAPVFRLDHMAVTCEEHGDRLGHFLEAVIRYGRKRRDFSVKLTLIGLVVSLLAGVLSFAMLLRLGAAAQLSPEFLPFLGGAVTILFFVGWLAGIRPLLLKAFHQSRLVNLDELGAADTPARRESWDFVKGLVKEYLESKKGRIKMAALRKEHDIVQKATRRIAKDVRSALIQLMK